MTAIRPAPLRGDVWLLNLDLTLGHEQAGKRPALVISADIFNAGPAGLVIVCPVTSKSKGIRLHIPVAPPEGGLNTLSYIKCEDVRSVSNTRLIKRLGAVADSTMTLVEDILRTLMVL